MINSRLLISISKNIYGSSKDKLNRNICLNRGILVNATSDKNIKENKKINYDKFWNKVRNNLEGRDSRFESEIKYLLEEYGTSRITNRFTIGNTIEIIVSKMFEDIGYDVVRSVDSKRYDMKITDEDGNNMDVSVKYSSKRNIIVANTFGSDIYDESLCDMLLLTPDKLYFLNEDVIREHGIKLKEYSIIKKDTVQINRDLLKVLNDIKYPYMAEVNIKVKFSKNKSTVEMFYKQFEKDFLEYDKNRFEN